MSILAADIVEADGVPALSIGGTEIPVPDELRSAVGRASAATVLAGLRPRQVSLTPSHAAGAIPAAVYNHEIVGRDSQLMLQVNGDQLRYRTAERLHHSVGDAVAVKIELHGARLFDRESGRALT